MQISRDWATPLTIGAFVLMAVTGILMFFHLDTGLNKEAHEWLGWAMVAGVAAHVVANFSAFKRHFARGSALAIIGVYVVLLGASFFIQEEDEGGNPARRASQAVLAAPISAVAGLTSRTPDQLVADLRAAGFQVTSAQQTLNAVTGPERDKQFKALAVIFH